MIPNNTNYIANVIVGYHHRRSVILLAYCTDRQQHKLQTLQQQSAISNNKITNRLRYQTKLS